MYRILLLTIIIILIIIQDVTALITTAGGEVDAEKLSVLLADVEGKDINELLAKGEESIKSISTGGGGGGGAAAPAAAGKFIY